MLVSHRNSFHEMPAFAGMTDWGRHDGMRAGRALVVKEREPVGEAAVARAACAARRPFGAMRFARRLAPPLRPKTNARAVSDPGACVTIARQPPCNFRPRAFFKAELEVIPEPRPLTCVS